MLVSWSWEWASCTIFSRAVVDTQTVDEVKEHWVAILLAVSIRYRSIIAAGLL